MPCTPQPGVPAYDQYSLLVDDTWGDMDVTTLVLDDGGGTKKYGFCGEDSPIQSIDHWGDEHASCCRKNGLIVDWDAAESEWSDGFAALRQRDSQLSPTWRKNQAAYGEGIDGVQGLDVLMGRHPLAPLDQYTHTAEIYFESFGVHAFNLESNNVLAIYASGRTSDTPL